MSCDFVMELSKLRKLSAESVENTKEFDDFKRYMHVEREVEKELRALLHEINNKQEKCLLLLCGSAGDGKSHLISYLKNSDSENLLENFDTYNDATESSAPNLTAIETLSKELAAFNDDNFEKQDGTRLIIAINLGTLNNFIESEQGKSFTRLKKYVDENKILAGFGEKPGYHENSVFQHVSFSDYQVFSLNENGVNTDFLKNLFSRVFNQNDDNPFYQAFCCGETCSACKKCPVRHNYEFMMDEKHQDAVIERIIEIVIKDKAIISTREVLNLIYDILVHPDFNRGDIINTSSEVEYLSKYIEWTTPMLLNEYDDLSPVLNLIKQYDVLKNRSETGDEDALRFHAKENIEDDYVQATEGSPYQILNNLTDVSVLGGKKANLKKLVYKFIIRIRDLNKIQDENYNHDLKEYVEYLYFQNSGKENNLRKLYEATRKAIMSWDGQFEDDSICIDDSNDQYWVLEQLNFKSAIDKNVTPVEGEVYRFSPTLTLRFKKDSDDPTLTPVTISVDYALFELILKMKEGYRPTVQDKNRHADFVSFIQRISDFGNKSNRVTIVPKDGTQNIKMIFEETEFGYDFKVVQ